MKRFTLVAAAVLAVAPHANAQKNPAASMSDQTGTKEEILAIEEERNRAIISGDAVALERMTSDDYTFITLRGELRTKREVVQGFKSGSFHYESREISDLDVRVY